MSDESFHSTNSSLNNDISYIKHTTSSIQIDYNHSVKKLNIVSYNIDGLMSKIYDSDFLDFVENFDIVCFLETFMIENTLPNNISNHSYLCLFCQQMLQLVGDETREVLLC